MNDAVPFTAADTHDEPPLAQELRRHWAGERASFHMPGHKGGPGTSALARELLGDAALAADVSEMGGFDYLHAPEAGMTKAQAQAAEFFGAGRTFFLVNGSTAGNLAALVSTLGDGDGVVMSRGSHRSVFTGTVLAGAVPSYVPLVHDRELEGWFVGDVDAFTSLVRSAPSRGAPIRAIHVTRPNYYGMCCDLAPYVREARRLEVPLIVDEAHGSHLGLHPDLPRSALAEGADVVIQSTHKTLGALTQSSMLHLRDGAPVDADVVARTLQMLQSSSPSVLLTLSLDLARDVAARDGKHLLGRALAFAEEIRVAAEQIGLQPYREPRSAGVNANDLTKVVIDVTPLGLSGFEASAQLRERNQLWVELADFRRIVCSITIGDTAESVALLIDALHALQPEARGTSTRPSPPMPPLPALAYSPRAATQQPSQATPWSMLSGRVSAEYVIPYPPGIPLVVPGEVLDEAVLRAIEAFRSGGSRIVGPADASCETLRVLA